MAEPFSVLHGSQGAPRPVLAQSSLSSAVVLRASDVRNRYEEFA
jgi:hypothetical protein